MTTSTAPPLEERSRLPLQGKVFVFSGRLASLSRREAVALVRLHGGLTRRHVSSRTSYLVLGEAPQTRPLRRSRKLQDAGRLGAGDAAGVQVIGETRFLELLGLESACRLRDRYYSSRDVQRIYGFERRTLRMLENLSLVSPILRTNAERYYTFSDLLLLRRVHAATERGGSLGNIARRLLLVRAGQERLPFAEEQPALLSFEPPLDGMWSANDWYNLGCEHDEDPAESEEAVKAYRRTLELDPYHVGALINLGNLTYDLGNIDEARRLYERALASDPDNSIAHFNLGNVYDDMGEYERAIRYFRTAIRLRPDNFDAHFNLGLVYDRLGEVDDVRKHMQLYLRLAPDGDMAEVAREYLQLTDDATDPVQI